MVSGMKEVLEFSTQKLECKKTIECLALNRQAYQEVLLGWPPGLHICSLHGSQGSWLIFEDSLGSKPRNRKWLSLNYLKKVFTRISSLPIDTFTLHCFLHSYFNLKAKLTWQLLDVGLPNSHIPGFFLPSWSEFEARSSGQREESLHYFLSWTGSWWSMAVTSTASAGVGHSWWGPCPSSRYGASDLPRSQSCYHSLFWSIAQTSFTPFWSLDLGVDSHVFTCVCVCAQNILSSLSCKLQENRSSVHDRAPPPRHA